jgi:hypothetical protein
LLEIAHQFLQRKTDARMNFKKFFLTLHVSLGKGPKKLSTVLFFSYTKAASET